jgi:hypothetical protein
MKTKYFIPIFFLLFSILLVCCTEEYVGQPATDSTPPGIISVVKVESTPGGANIIYKAPSDPDLLYVKAYYNLNGEMKNVSASLYADTLKIVGFGSTEPQTIQVRCVDRSGNEGEAVPVDIKPLTPVIEQVFETIKMVTASGGVQLTWENKARGPVAIMIYADDDNGYLTEADIVYTSTPKGKYTLRGFDDKERKFAVKVRDRWGNNTQMKEEIFTPYFEEEIPKEKGKGAMKRYWLPFDNPTDISWTNYEFWNMFDGITVGENMFHTNYGPPQSPVYFTIDLGRLVKLGRYKLWYREGTAYSHHNPRKWRLYATADPRPSQDAHSSDDAEYWNKDANGIPPGKFATDTELGWYKVGDFEVEKPSLNGGSAQDDSDAMLAGFEFEVSPDLPPIRYIRFELVITWGGSTDNVHISELGFWGKIIK